MCGVSWPTAPPADVVFYEPAERDRGLLPHDPFKAIIAPRPIGWISTADADGRHNLAPYSFFNAISDAPPILMFSSAGMKDSAAIAIASGDFVWNLVTWSLHEAMNETSKALPRGRSEFDLAGLTPVRGERVRAPRVAETPVALECVVTQTLTLRDRSGDEIDRHVVCGEVVGVHLDESFVLPDGRVDTAGLLPVSRGGYLDEYAVLREVFPMPRPE